MPAKKTGNTMFTRMDDDAREMIARLMEASGLSQSRVIDALCRKALGLPGVNLDRLIRDARREAS